MVGPIHPLHFALCIALSYGDSTLNSDLGFPGAKHAASLEWGAAALNMTADLFVQTHSAFNGDSPEAAASTLRELSSKLMDTSSASPSKGDAKLAQKLGANALKLGAKVLASTEVSDGNDHHAREFVADHENATQFPESADLEWFKSRMVHEESDIGHGKHANAHGKVQKARVRSKMQRPDTPAPPVLPSRDLLQNALSNGAFEDNSVATSVQTCSFTLTLSRSHGDRKNFKMQATSAIDDSFHVQGCSTRGCDGKGFCAHHCIKQGAAGINVIKNQHGKEVGYANCCSETNAIVHTKGCAKAPLDSKLATDLAHRFPSIARKTVDGVIQRASGDATLATEELRSLALSPTRDHDQTLAPTTRLRRSNSKEESQEVSQHAAPSFIDKMREQAQQRQSAAEVEA